MSKEQQWCQSEWGGAPCTLASKCFFGHLNKGSLLRPSLRQPLRGVTIGRRYAAGIHTCAGWVRPAAPRVGPTKSATSYGRAENGTYLGPVPPQGLLKLVTDSNEPCTNAGGRGSAPPKRSRLLHKQTCVSAAHSHLLSSSIPHPTAVAVHALHRCCVCTSGI